MEIFVGLHLYLYKVTDKSPVLRAVRGAKNSDSSTAREVFPAC